MVRRTTTTEAVVTAVAHGSNLDEDTGRYRFMKSSSISAVALVASIRLYPLIRKIYEYSNQISWNMLEILDCRHVIRTLCTSEIVVIQFVFGKYHDIVTDREI